jgi:hypothetical protein
MNYREVLVARVYLTEGQHLLEKLMRRLHDEDRVRGVTVFRGVAGFGPSGRLHTAELVDLALNLPLVVEFFDEPARVRAVVAKLDEIVAPGHVIVWPAQVTWED